MGLSEFVNIVGFLIRSHTFLSDTSPNVQGVLRVQNACRNVMPVPTRPSQQQTRPLQYHLKKWQLFVKISHDEFKKIFTYITYQKVRHNLYKQ